MATGNRRIVILSFLGPAYGLFPISVDHMDSERFLRVSRLAELREAITTWCIRRHATLTLFISRWGTA